jgi:hypothetical protein
MFIFQRPLFAVIGALTVAATPMLLHRYGWRADAAPGRDIARAVQTPAASPSVAARVRHPATPPCDSDNQMESHQ